MVDEDLLFLTEDERDVFLAFANHTITMDLTCYANYSNATGPTLIFDSGADSTIIGQGWQIQTYTGR